MKIISGGQTGADRGGLEGARNLGIPTGGTAPLGFRTENGNDPSLAEFGLVENGSSSYPPRTKKNVADSDITLWFGRTGSPGWKCTSNACLLQGKGLYVADPWDISQVEEMRRYVKQWTPQVINIAGNRESTNPGIQDKVAEAIEVIFS